MSSSARLVFVVRRPLPAVLDIPRVASAYTHTPARVVAAAAIAMSDVRALLRAKRQEARVTHPLASYSSSGQLRCIACSITIKQAASWDGHIGSKTHRVNATRLREAEQARLDEESIQTQAKRKADEALVQQDADGDVDMSTSSPESKRRKVDDGDPSSGPGQQASARGFPADFFSDPSKAPELHADEDDEEAQLVPASAADAPIDEEWERFQQQVLNPPTDDDRRDAFERATIIAEPVLAAEVPEGFPPSLVQEENADQSAQPELSEEDIRKQKEQEERELIMDRLMEEERAQEEADAKVSMLKSKVDALKRKREAAKAARTKMTT